MIKTDFLIIGSGLSGLLAALKLSKIGSVILITKRSLADGSTSKAQGGIACVWSQEDSFESHIKDTMTVGCGISREDIVEKVVKSGPSVIDELMGFGVNFSKQKYPSGVTENDIELGLEGGHSHRRILHVEDRTGPAIEDALIKKVKSAPDIKLTEFAIAIDLITKNKIEGIASSATGNICYGAYVLDIRKSEVIEILANFTIIATGGAGKVYLYTSNPDVSTGDGIAMAARAGARIANMEFVQFHPTCLYFPGSALIESSPENRSFLISEALRGEGAVLYLKGGKKFMEKYHPLAELAPRDVVARAIDSEMKKSGEDFVYLDISHKPSNFIKKRFPKIYEKCSSLGIDITANPIPVVPSAHYFCGGVLVNEHGETNINRLFAIGEASCTGLHGANRLASNSLLECASFADFLSDKISSLPGEHFRVKFPKIPKWNPGKARDSDESVVLSQNWDEIRHFMWNYVGILRSNKRLERAKKRIGLIAKEINDYYWDFLIGNDIIELRNIAVVADLIIRSAVMRKESRGIHYNIDYPNQKKSFARPTVI